MLNLDALKWFEIDRAGDLAAGVAEQGGDRIPGVTELVAEFALLSRGLIEVSSFAAMSA
jgi:hypothetical protein